MKEQKEPQLALPKTKRRRLNKKDRQPLELQKKGRIEDRAMLDRVHLERCTVNGCPFMAEPAHYKSRGAFGDDTPENVYDLCRIHHTEQHKMGWRRFKLKYPEVKTFAQVLAEREKLRGVC
jgi:hypothetical protein